MAQVENPPEKPQSQPDEQRRQPQGEQGQKPKEEKKEPRREKAKGYFATHPIALVILLVVLCGLLVGGYFLWQYLQSYETTDDAQIDGHVNSLGARISGTIKAVYVEETQTVKAGQLVAEIDPADYIAAVDRAKADVAQAQAQYSAQVPNVPLTAETTSTTTATSTASVAEESAGVATAESNHQAAIAALRQAEANNVQAQADVQRYAALVQKDEVSREQYDAKVAAAKTAAAQVDAQQANVAATQKQIDQARARLSSAESEAAQARRVAPNQVAIQRANVSSRKASILAAQAALTQAELNLQYTKIYAPVDGVVGRRSIEVGTQVQAGQQVISIVQLGDLWVTANFKETQLRNMRTGQRATIHVDAYKREFDGYVERIAGASGARFSLLPPENATGNYVKVVQRIPVRIRFNKDQQGLNLLRPGMSVDPKVWIK